MTRVNPEELIRELWEEFKQIHSRVKEASKAEHTSSKELARLIDAESKVLKNLFEAMKTFRVQASEKDLVKMLSDVAKKIREQESKRRLMAIKEEPTLDDAINFSMEILLNMADLTRLLIQLRGEGHA